MSSIVKVFQPTGILERNTADILRRQISDVLNSGADTVLLDLKEVTFIDSSGLSALVTIKKKLQTTGAKLYICSIKNQVRVMFELTRLERVFQIFANRDEFESAILSKNSKS